MFSCSICNLSIVELSGLVSLLYLLVYCVYVAVCLLVRRTVGDFFVPLSDYYVPRIILLAANAAAWGVATVLLWALT